MTDRHFFSDTATASLTYAGDGEITTDNFDPSKADTVTLDTPWEDFFDNDEFVQFDATVAQPIVQPYILDGEMHTFKKDEQELKQSQAQLDNLGWTTGHPEHDRITSTDQIRGFWSDPQYSDGQTARLNIPANDSDAIRFAVTNDEVSVGFSGTLDWVDDDSVEYDAVQRNMVYDHVASVENGRCPPEKGCGLHTDGVDSDNPHGLHGHVIDALQTQETETPESDEWSEGDWVSFTADGQTRHGKLAYVDAERALVKVYDTDDEEFADNSTTIATASLNNWVGPYADSCPGDTCSCGCHLHTDEQTTDTNMTNLEELLNDNDITAEQVLDHYGVEKKESPTDFYDGEPEAEDLAEDFDTVENLVDERDLLADEKESLESEKEDLADSLREYERGEYEDKVETLTDLTDKWSEDDLMEKFDQEIWTTDDIDEKIELVKEIKSDDTTTVADSSGGESTTDNDNTPERTGNGRFDLRQKTK